MYNEKPLGYVGLHIFMRNLAFVELKGSATQLLNLCA